MSKAQDLKVRLPIEIAKYHDMLDEILHNPEINKIVNWENEEKSREQMITIKRTLCWVLQHDEGRWLSDNMDKLGEAMEKLGFKLERLQ